MKKGWYRGKPAKAILIALEHIALIAAIICGIFLMDQYNSGYQFSDSWKGAYAKTTGCAKQVWQAAGDVLYGIRSDRLLQTETASGKRRVLDIASIENGDYVFKNESGLAYYVDDLIEWAEKTRTTTYEYEASEYYSGEAALAYSTQADSTGFQVVVCRKPDGSYQYYELRDFLQQIEDEKLILLTNRAWGSEKEVRSNILQDLRNGSYTEDTDIGLQAVADNDGNVKFLQIWNYPQSLPKETYKPVGADSLLDVVNENPEWNGRLTDACNMLNNTLDAVSSLLSTSAKMAQYSDGNTNLRFFYVNSEKKLLYSNIPDYGGRYSKMIDYEKTPENIIRSTESYAVIRPKLADCESTLDTKLTDWQHTIADLGLDGDYIFAVALDPKLPIQDSFAEEDSQFRRCARWVRPALVGECLSILLLLACLILLTLAAGRQPEDDVVRLNWFDRWYTELAVLAVLLIWGIGFGSFIGIAESMSYTDAWTTDVICIWASCTGVFSCAMALIAWLSLVRRFRARTLWSNSLLIRILRLLKRFWEWLRVFAAETAQNMGSVWKMLAIFVGFLIAQLFLTVFLFAGGFILFLPILLALDGFALYYLLKRANGRQKILDGLERITGGELNHKIPADQLKGEQKTMAEYINRIGDGLDAAVDQSLRNERMKTELITNVSHDIKTPLTSIINYIDLLKRENFEDPKIQGYLDILESKAHRLKVLTEDVVEASKVSTGNISLEMTNLDFTELLNQVTGEFQERFLEKNLHLIAGLPAEPVVIRADGRRLWRVLENIFNNTAKYALSGTRVYADLIVRDRAAEFSLKNISAQPLNISADELTERFIRGDVSRTTEGSGLGLSIAKSLTALMRGDFRLYLDGDLFKVIISFPVV